jgi:hypothetical protein
MSLPKKPWTKPVLRKIEPTPELLKIFLDKITDAESSFRDSDLRRKIAR